jgi:hypothetical protein
MIRFMTLLKTLGESSTNGWQQAITEEALSLEESLAGLGEVRHAFAMVEMPSLAGGGFRVVASSFDAVLEVVLSEADSLGAAVEAFEGLATRLDQVVDPSQSAALVGTEHLIRPGMGEVEIHACLRRAPGRSHDEFSDFWLHGFAPTAQLAPHMSGYRQVHADGAQTKRAAAAAGLALDDFDGVAVEWFDSLQGLQKASAWAEAQQVHNEASRQGFSVERMLFTENLAE